MRHHDYMPVSNAYPRNYQPRAPREDSIWKKMRRFFSSNDVPSARIAPAPSGITWTSDVQPSAPLAPLAPLPPTATNAEKSTPIREMPRVRQKPEISFENAPASNFRMHTPSKIVYIVVPAPPDPPVASAPPPSVPPYVEEPPPPYSEENVKEVVQ